MQVGLISSQACAPASCVAPATTSSSQVPPRLVRTHRRASTLAASRVDLSPPHLLHAATFSSQCLVPCPHACSSASCVASGRTAATATAHLPVARTANSAQQSSQQQAANGWDAFGPDDEDDVQAVVASTRPATAVQVVESNAAGTAAAAATGSLVKPSRPTPPPQQQQQLRPLPPTLPLQQGAGHASAAAGAAVMQLPQQQPHPSAAMTRSMVRVGAPPPELLVPAPRPTQALVPPRGTGQPATAPQPQLQGGPQLQRPGGTHSSDSLYPYHTAPKQPKAKARWEKVRFDAHARDPSSTAISTYDDMPVQVEVWGGGEAGNPTAPAPHPVRRFDKLHGKRFKWSLVLLRAMEAHRYYRPTPVQGHAIACIAQGRDVCAVSPTGSGKTLAYLLPLLATLMKHSRDGGPRNTAYPPALILAPTRELVAQIHEEVVRLVRGSHLKAVQVHGGEAMAKQALALRGGCDLVVATPGRLLDLVARKTLHLGRVFLTAVDEADKMMELGWEHELRRLLTHSQLASSSERQTLMFSSRMSGELAGVAARYLRPGCCHIRVGHETGAAPLVTHRVVAAAVDARLRMLGELLTGSSSTGEAAGGAASVLTDMDVGGAGTAAGGLTVVFTNTIKSANKVHQHVVSELGLSAGLLHSGLPQASRDEAMECFRYGLTPVLVTTMLAARGVDVPDVGRVINYDAPPNMTEYVQRCGRTGRGGRPGVAVTLLTPRDARLAPMLVHVMQAVEQQPPEWLQQLAHTEQQRQQRRRAPDACGAGAQAAASSAAAGSPAGVRDTGSYIGHAAAAAAAAAVTLPWPDLRQANSTSGASSAAGSGRAQQDKAAPAAAAAAGSRAVQGSGRSASLAADELSKEASNLPGDDELLRQWYTVVASQRTALAAAAARWPVVPASAAAVAAGAGGRWPPGGVRAVPPLTLPPSLMARVQQRAQAQAQAQAQQEEQAAAAAATLVVAGQGSSSVQAMRGGAGGKRRIPVGRGRHGHQARWQHGQHASRAPAVQPASSSDEADEAEGQAAVAGSWMQPAGAGLVASADGGSQATAAPTHTARSARLFAAFS